VDAAIIAAQTDEGTDSFLAELDKVFRLKILGEPQRFLDYDIYQITLQKFSIFLCWKDPLKVPEYPIMAQG